MEIEYGKILRKIKTEKRLSQKEIGALIGVTGQFISRVEKGLNGLSPEKARIIEEKLGFSFEEEQKRNSPDYIKILLQKEFNLSEQEYEELVKFIEEDKYTLFLLIKARQGDIKAADTLKKLLSD